MQAGQRVSTPRHRKPPGSTASCSQERDLSLPKPLKSAILRLKIAGNLANVGERVICWNLPPDTLFARQNYSRIGVSKSASPCISMTSKVNAASIARPLAVTGLLPDDRSARVHRDQSKRRF